MNEEVIKLINTGLKLKLISESTGTAYSTVRKLASIVNFINSCDYLSEEHINTVKALGLNAVVLIPLKEQSDFLIYLLESIDASNITREQLLDLKRNYQNINASKVELEEEHIREIKRIDECIALINKKLQTLVDKKDVLNNEFQYVKEIKKLKPDIFKAYLQLVGIYNNRYCLAKRINSSLWNRLRKSEIIDVESEYIKGDHLTVSYIINMCEFVKSTINAFKVNDYFKSNALIKGIIPINYITIDKQIEPHILKYKTELESYKLEKLQCRENILKVSKKAISNYFEQREFRDKFMNKDTITHTNISKGGLKWLVHNNYIGTIELKSDKYLFDVAAYNEYEVVILEAKVSVSDLKSDNKLANYLNYCDKMYIISNDEYVCLEALKVDKNIGVILLNSSFKFHKILKKANYVGNGRIDIKHSINLKNTKLLAMTF